METDRKVQTAPPVTTRDGHRVMVTATASTPVEASQAVQLGAEGIGLFTCEALYREKMRPPTEEELLAVYRPLAEVPGTRPAVIRLPDLDWQEWPDHGREKNPALGRRGIRLALAVPGLLRPQLRAVLRAGAARPVRLALPFVSSVNEVLRVKQLLSELAEELAGTLVAVPYVGLMADLPAVAAAIDIMACETSFFHVGDNLIKYLMGTDDGNGPDLFDAAFLQQCRILIENAHSRHKKVAVSAGIVREDAAVPVLIGLGFDELTVPAGSVAPTRQLVQQTHYAASRLIAAKTLSFRDPREARAYAADALAKGRV